MKKLLALLALLLASPAIAQQFPTIPDKTVIGRIGVGNSSGPSQAIPFSTLTGVLGTGYIIPLNFGAKCDGRTDDHVALQNALTAAAGGTLFIPPNTTCVTGTTLIVPSNIAITGAGREVSSIKGIGNALPVFNITDQSNVEISNLWLQGSDSVTQWVSSSVGAISLTQDNNATVAGTNYLFKNLKLSGFNSNYWIVTSNSSTTKIMSNVSLLDSYALTTTADIPTDPTSTNNNNFFFAQFGGAAGIRTENTVIRGNRIDGAAFCFGTALFNNNYKYAIQNNQYISIGSTNTVAHCTNTLAVTNSYAALVYDANNDGNPPLDGLIQNNYVLNPYSAGFYIAGDGVSGHTALSFNSFNLLISGNEIVGQSATDTNLPRGAISINSATNIQVTGNKLYTNYNGIIASSQWTGFININANTCYSNSGASLGVGPSCVDIFPGPGTTGNTPVYSITDNLFQIDSASSAVIRGHSNSANYYGAIDVSNNKIAAAEKGIDFAGIYINKRLMVSGDHFSGTAATSLLDASSVNIGYVNARNSTFDLSSSTTGLGAKFDTGTAYIDGLTFQHRNSGSAFAYSAVGTSGTLHDIQFQDIATANQVVASSMGLAKPTWIAAAGDRVQNLAVNTGSYQTTFWINPTNGANWIIGGTLSALTSAHLFVGNGSNVPADVAASGDLSLSNAGAFTLATVNSNVGSFGSATQCVAFTTNGKGLITAASAVTCTPAVASLTGAGTGVLTALGNAVNANSGLITQSAFSSYTPTVTSTGGALTTVTNNGSSNMTIGNVIFVQFDFTLTTVGTGTGFLDVSVPTYSSIIMCTAFELNNGNGLGTATFTDTTHIRLKSYNNATTVAANDRWQGGCSLRLQ